MAAPVSFSGWILIMASLGWAGACPNKKAGSRTCLVPTVGFSGKTHFPTTMRAQAPAQTKETMMRFYNRQHRFYCGIDLHARTLAVCILDQAGAVLFEGNLAADPATFLH